MAFTVHSLALVLGGLGLVGAVEEPAAEELNGDDGEDELEEDVHDEDVGHVLQRVHHAVKHRLRMRQGHSQLAWRRTYNNTNNNGHLSRPHSGEPGALTIQTKFNTQILFIH